MIEGETRPGATFHFLVNGIPIFAKGASVIPLDQFESRATPEKYEQLVVSAVEANMNMLRVWGGGGFLPKVFYDLCDKYGILVWQDLPFAQAMYPRDEVFLSNVKSEVRHQIRQLSNHPSIILWCGNSENEE